MQPTRFELPSFTVCEWVCTCAQQDKGYRKIVYTNKKTHTALAFTAGQVKPTSVYVCVIPGIIQVQSCYAIVGQAIVHGTPNDENTTFTAKIAHLKYASKRSRTGDDTSGFLLLDLQPNEEGCGSAPPFLLCGERGIRYHAAAFFFTSL